MSLDDQRDVDWCWTGLVTSEHTHWSFLPNLEKFMNIELDRSPPPPFAPWYLYPRLSPQPVELFIGLQWLSLSLSDPVSACPAAPQQLPGMMYAQLYQPGLRPSTSRPLFQWPSPGDAGHCCHWSICPPGAATATERLVSVISLLCPWWEKEGIIIIKWEWVCVHEKRGCVTFSHTDSFLEAIYHSSVQLDETHQ